MVSGNNIVIGSIISALCVYGAYVLYRTYFSRKQKSHCMLFNEIHRIENKLNIDIMFIVDGFWVESIKELEKYVMDINDNESFIERIHDITKNNSSKPLSIILYTTGGSIFNSDMIVQILLTYSNKVNIYIPCFAYSAGTMIALCADELFMNKYSIMGPVDPQLTYSVDDKGDEDDASARCFMQLLDEKEDISDSLYLKALESQSLHDDNIDNLRNILKVRKIPMTKKKRKRFIEELASGKHPHHKPFSIDKIKQIGIPVTYPVPSEINNLFSTFVKYKNLIYTI